MGDLNINDGNGIWDNAGLCDTIIADCNNAVKKLIDGRTVEFCGLMYQIALKVTNLKKGIKADLESKDKIIEELKQMNNALVEQQTGLPVDKEGAENGAD